MGWSSCAAHPKQTRAGVHCCDGCDRCPQCDRVEGHGWKGTQLYCQTCCGPLYACPDCVDKIRTHIAEAARRKADEAAGQLTFVKCQHKRCRCIDCGAEQLHGDANALADCAPLLPAKGGA